MKRALAVTTLTLVFVALALAQQPQSAPVASPSPTTTTTRPGMTAETSGPAVDQLKQLEQDWAKAAMNKDKQLYSRLEAPDYKFVMPDGKVRGRDEDLTALANSSYSQNSVSDLDVRVYGDTAVVTGLAQIKGTENGKDISGSYRFTDVWVKRDGNWQAVNTTAARLQQP
jgi:ketosteroid isomerase-like protein